jgi:hypothetical protein
VKTPPDRSRSRSRSRSRTRPPILILSGWDPELEALRTALKHDHALARRVVTRPAGVGLVEAGIGATRIIAELNPRAVIFVGTAGVYPPSPIAIGTAIVARHLKLVSTAVLRGDGYLPAVLPTETETDAQLRRALARGLPVADVACPLAITKTRAAARRLASIAAVENLEAFGRRPRGRGDPLRRRARRVERRGAARAPRVAASRPRGRGRRLRGGAGLAQGAHSRGWPRSMSPAARARSNSTSMARRTSGAISRVSSLAYIPR